MSETARPGRFGRALDSLAAESSRRGFLARAGGALTALTAGGLVAKAVKPGEAEGFHFCGHIYTTGSCLHPTGLPRIDAKGLPIRAADGRPVDDQGRYIDAAGIPVDEDGNVLTDADGTPLPRTSRTPVCAATADVYGFTPYVDGAWYRCCGGHVRKLVDCCGTMRNRINGDKALKGYCYRNRKVFCVMYFQTKVKC